MTQRDIKRQGTRPGIPRKAGNTTIVGEFTVTKMKPNHFAALHETTGRKFVLFSNGLTHVWHADEVMRTPKGDFKRSSTPCISYRSMSDLLTKTLPSYIKRSMTKEMREQARHIREQREFDRNHFFDVKSEKVPRPPITYTIVKESHDRVVYEGPDPDNPGTLARWAVANIPENIDGYTYQRNSTPVADPNRWVIIKEGEIRPLYRGDSKEGCIRELTYLLLGPDIVSVYTWVREPKFIINFDVREDDSVYIRVVHISGFEYSDAWCETVQDGLTELSRLSDEFRRLSNIPEDSDDNGTRVGGSQPDAPRTLPLTVELNITHFWTDRKHAQMLEQVSEIVPRYQMQMAMSDKLKS